jgi:signal recognition particle subunit SRP54
VFESLTGKFNSIFKSLSGQGRITEANVSDAVREVRKALLEADVNYQVVKQFCKDVTQAAIGAEVIKSLHPGQVFVKIAGLQGGGKTTTAAKLAKYIVSKGKKTLLVADDLQRPAAIDQLIVLGQQLNIDVYSEESKNAVKVAKNALKHAKKNTYDVVVLDTAGRLHIDQEMMTEISDVAKAVTPHQE